MGYISEKYVSKRPYLEILCLSNDYWLGSVSPALSCMKSTGSTANSILPTSIATDQNQNHYHNEPDVVVLVMSKLENDFWAMKAFEISRSPHEELVHILTGILKQPDRTSSVSEAVSRDGFPSDGAALRSVEDMKSARARLHINPDGSMQLPTRRQDIQDLL